jgi:hypothetical protein
MDVSSDSTKGKTTIKTQEATTAATKHSTEKPKVCGEILLCPMFYRRGCAALSTTITHE